MKKKLRFLRSLRFRIMLILVIIGIVPSIIVEKGIVNSYEDRAVSLRTIGIKNQCDILRNQLITGGYLDNPESASIDPVLTMLSNVYSGRVLIVNQNFQVVKDTYDIDEGKYMISQEVLQCFQNDEESSNYDRKNGYFEMTMPIHESLEDGSEVRGVLLISASTEEITTSIGILEQRGNRILTIIVGLVLVLGYILARILMKPFAKVGKAIEDVTDGYQDEEISVPDYLETEMITDSFNRMFSRIKSLDHSRQEFVSNVSHELKTPLTSMKVLADSLVGQENVPIELYQEFMADIAEEIDRENKIITDLLTLVRLDKKAANLHVEPININELLDLILKRLKPIAAKKNVTLNLENFRTVIAEIDETKLSLAITNLIENAIKYNREEGWVRVSLNADHKYFYVTVADSGQGIPEDSLDHIFERFYRVDKSHSTEIEGTGLGLAITKSAIIMHHGAIRVKSQVGEGTTFSVRIPLLYEE